MMAWLLFMMAFVPSLVKILLPLPFALAAVHQSAIAAMPLKESIRMIDHDNTKAVDRSKYRLIQTPQTFSVSLIKKAYEMQEDLSLTDDAA
jgi:2-C-methyl-D-erythritol 4-phosphate cytidylyltransferase